MSFQSRLKQLRLNKKLTQQDVADKLGITRQAYGYYENEKSKREPDHESTRKLAEIFEVSTDYLLGIALDKNKITVAGKEIELTQEEFEVFNEIRKHSVAFHDLATDPEKKVKQLIKMWEFIKKDLNDDDEGEGFGELED